MNREIAILREVVVKVTQLLAGQGLKVTQQGTNAFVQYDKVTLKPSRVNIPYLPDTASPELILAIQGFIDHEVAHILFTDSRVTKEGHLAGASINTMRNIIEDTFIEREMGKRFPGSLYNLDKLHGFFLKEISEPALRAVAGNVEKEFSIIVVPLIRAWSGQVVFQRWIADNNYAEHPLVKALTERLPVPIRERIAKIKHSSESLEIARIIDAILRPPKMSTPSPDKSKDKGEDSEPSKDKSESDGKGENKDKPEDEEDKGSAGEKPETDEEEIGEGAKSSEDEEEGEDEREDEGTASEPSEPAGDDTESVGDDADGDDSGDDEGDDDEAGDGGSEGDDPGEEGDIDADEAEGKGSGADAEEGDDESDDAESVGTESSDEAGDDAESEAGKGKPGDKEGEKEGDAGIADESEEIDADAESPFHKTDVDLSEKESFSGEISKKIAEDVADATREADYRVFTRDHDEIGPFKVSRHFEEFGASSVARLDDEVRHMIGPMQKEIERMMAAKSRVQNVPGFRSGRLHGANLHRVAAGDDRLFRRRFEAKSKATAVSLLIDNSGSMGGQRQQIAMQAGYALSLTLERVGVPHEVIGFTTRNYSSSVEMELEAEERRAHLHYTRIEPLYMPVYKGFNERINPTIRQRFAEAAFVQGYLKQNIDGECVQIAAQRLAQQPGERRVLIVLSDGEPACRSDFPDEITAHLHRAIAEVERARIEVVGIGIQTSSVKRFYKKNVVINNLNELPGKVMGELKRVLLAA